MGLIIRLKNSRYREVTMFLVHEMLMKSAQHFPNKDAFISHNKRCTFQEVDEASAKLAHFLTSNGIMAGDRIGIFSSKSIEEIIAIIAILKMGGILVHINPHYKEKQLSHVVHDADLKMIFLHESKIKLFNSTYPNNKCFNLIISLSPNVNVEHDHIYYLNDILKNNYLASRLINKVKENDPAAILYTSGSTGKPKGIIVTHKIFHDATVVSAGVLENTENDRLISVTPFCFDGALSQLFTSIYVGGTLVLQESTFPNDIVTTMLTEKITGFHAVPSFWRMLLQKHSTFKNYEYPSLRYISVIGETFPHEELIRLAGVLNKAKIFMMYGITEAFRSTYLSPNDFERKNSSVGKAFPGVEVLIVDENGKRCNTGEVGEIVHKGLFVSPGYWNDPVKTSKIFKGGILYTGDLGKMDNEGYVYFIGRKDSMIKVSGYRVSPKEIEECLYKLPGISEVAIISIPDEQVGNKIKAIISCVEGVSLTEKSVSIYCKKYLPYFMVPSFIEFRTSLPKTGTFKINRSQLN